MFVKQFKDTTEIVSGDCAALRELLNPRNEHIRINFSLAWAQVKPREKTIPHRLSYSEVYYILQGKGTMYIDEEQRSIKTRDTIYIPPNAAQWVENTGSGPLTFLCIVDPAWHPEAEQILDNSD